MRHPINAGPFTKRALSALICLSTATLAGQTHAALFQASSMAELKDAIEQANSNDEADTITLLSGFKISAADSVEGNTAFPAITSSITIDGQGSDKTVVERDETDTEYRFFLVTKDGDLTLNAMTLQGGYLGHSQTQDNTGGAVNNRGKLTVNDAVFNNNKADAGGAIANLSGGLLFVYDSTFNRNQTTWHNSEGDGGAIINEDGYTVIERSTFEENSTKESTTGKRRSDGGAIENSIGEMLIKDSVFVGNISYCGGAIENAIGKLTIVNSTFKDNIGTLHAGAVYGSEKRYRYDSSDFGDGLIEIRNSTISENEGGEQGGGAVFMDAGLAIISNSVLANNTAKFPDGSDVTNRQDCGYLSSGSTPGMIIVSGTNLITDAACIDKTAAPKDETSTIITKAAGNTTDIAALKWNADTDAGKAHYTLGGTSLALGEGSACDIADQLGVDRTANCDLGAVENKKNSDAGTIPDENIINIAGNYDLPVYKSNAGSGGNNSSSTPTTDDQASNSGTIGSTTPVAAGTESNMAADSGGGGVFNPLLLLLAIPALLRIRRK